MFSTSSQCKHWMFASDKQPDQLRREANSHFVNEHKHKIESHAEDLTSYFLTPGEERLLCNQYEVLLRDFCRKFQPPMPRVVMGTSFQYFKRFYLHNSVMDFHPKHIMVTCVYLSCKVEEFNVSMMQFVANIKGDRNKASDIILNNELLLMQQVQYHLIIYNPYRPIEGFLIDIKTRCLTAGDPERFREFVDEFIERCYFTDACLLVSPSQIALSAVVYAASKCSVDIDSYLSGILFSDSVNEYACFKDIMASLWTLMKAVQLPQKDQVKMTEKKLEKCRNQANNPDSQEYKKSLQESLDD